MGVGRALTPVGAAGGTLPQVEYLLLRLRALPLHLVYWC